MNTGTTKFWWNAGKQKPPLRKKIGSVQQNFLKCYLEGVNPSQSNPVLAMYAVF
jgi:hypothetical protein